MLVPWDQSGVLMGPKSSGPMGRMVGSTCGTYVNVGFVGHIDGRLWDLCQQVLLESNALGFLAVGSVDPMAYIFLQMWPSPGATEYTRLS